MLAKEIADIVDGCGEKFVTASMIGQTPNHESTAFFTRRREFATTLYYRILENILNKEQAQDLKVQTILKNFKFFFNVWFSDGPRTRNYSQINIRVLFGDSHVLL